MSFLAKLYVNDQVFRILDSNMHVHQPVGFNGSPVSIPQGGLLELSVESTTDRFFVDWMVSPTMMREGHIRYFRRDAMSKLFDVEFWDAYCVFYCEEFDDKSSIPLTTCILISPGIIRYAGSLIEKSWKVTDLEQLEAARDTTE